MTDERAVMISSTPRRTPNFEQELRDILLRVRSALASILEASGGYGPHVKDVCDALHVHRKLGWQIAKLACHADPFVAARFMPPPGGVKTFLEAAAARQVPNALLERASTAFADFERFVTVHADDRASLEMMLGSCSPDPDGAAQLSARKAAFTGNSAIFGAQARAHLVTAFVHPSSKPGWFDVARLHAYVGFRRNRPNVSWVIARTRTADDDYRKRSPEPREQLGLPREGDGSSGVPLLPQFCSSPLPELRRRSDAFGWVIEELVEAPVGNTGALTLVTAELTRQAARTYEWKYTRRMDWGVWVTTPCEVLVFDQFIHTGLFPAAQREVRLYANLVDPAHFGEGQLLPVFERVQAPGRGLEVVHTPDIPRYGEMARYIFEHMGWDPGQFELYRLRMQFPPIPTAVVVRHALWPTRVEAARAVRRNAH